MNAPLLLKRAAMYLRSSKDRADLSIAVQRNKLNEFAELNGFLTDPEHEFSDVVESGKDDDRPGFQSLLRAVQNRNRGWTVLLVLDTSRLARNVALAQFFENECKRRGIEVIYSMLPAGADPVMEKLLRVMLQGFDQFHSDMSRAKSVAGMKENIAQGYRVGGVAPYGYQREIIKKDTIRGGKNVVKVRLSVDPERGPIIQKYLKGRARGRSRQSLIREMGLDLCISTLYVLEQGVLTYAGHTVWNRRHELPFNKREFRERDQWVIEKNTHPALITDQEAEIILDMLQKGKKRRNRHGYKDRYLLSGLLRSPEGFNWSGATYVKKVGHVYPCYRVKFTPSGETKMRERNVPAEDLEKAILDQINKDVTTGALTKMVMAEAKKGQVTKDNEKQTRNSIRALETQIGKLDDQINDTLELAVLFKDKSKKTALVGKVEELEGEKQKLIKEKETLEAGLLTATIAGSGPGRVTEASIRAFGEKLLGVINQDQQTSRAQMRETMRGLINYIELDPETFRFTIAYKFVVDENNVHFSSVEPWGGKSNVELLTIGSFHRV